MEKDIKILEENLKNGSIYVNCGNTINKAIENVLWALKGKDCVIETQSHNEEVLEEYIAKLEKELETYKNEIKKYKHSMAMISEICIDESKVHITTREAIEEIRKYIYHDVDMDWARKEVEK